MSIFKTLFQNSKNKKQQAWQLVMATLSISMLSASDIQNEQKQDEETQLTKQVSDIVVSLSRELTPPPQEFNPDQPFERIITLGSNCAMKKQVNEYFNPHQKHWQINKKGHADLLDWVKIFDYNLIAMAIHNKLTDIFENMTLKDDYPHDDKYNISWIHMFHKPNINSVWENTCDIKTPSNFKKELQNIMPKLNHLKDKFINAKNKKTMYIFINDKDFNLDLEMQTLINLRNALIQIREGDKNFCLVATSEKKENLDFENIIVRKTPYGWDDTYKAILDEFKFAPDIWD